MNNHIPSFDHIGRIFQIIQYIKVMVVIMTAVTETTSDFLKLPALEAVLGRPRFGV